MPIKTTVPHYHTITAKWIGPTNTKPGRIKYISNRHGMIKIVSYSYQYDSMSEQAADDLQSWGYTPIGYAELPDGYIFFVKEFHP